MNPIPIAIPLLPLAAFAILVVFGSRLGRAAAYVAIGAIGASAALSVYVLSWTFGGVALDQSLQWFEIGSVAADFGIRIDALSGLMLLVVTAVSLLVHVYSIGYMGGEARYSVYFAYLSLFSAAMLMLVAVDNFLLLYICWELVGLCSFLLIGYYVDRPAAGDAAKKAFITTRIGDLGLLVAILAIYASVGSFRYSEVFAAAQGKLGAPAAMATVVGLLLFAGAIGKSAQIPLHVWLPDAMEGPTTASALIHAATMVAAGVYLVARAFPIISRSPAALETIAVVGLASSFFAATVALTQTDAKRILAYSTISQLGLMFVGVGTGAWVAGIFHLTTHAFFKALLFLAIGSIIHGTGEQHVERIRGAGRSMRITAATFAFGALALAAIPPFSGFFSKEEILSNLYSTGRYWMFAAALLISFLTALYIWRLGFGAIFAPEPEGDGAKAPHESPITMTVPLVILAAAALGVGFLGSPFSGVFQKFFDEPPPHVIPVPLTLSFVTAVAGVAVAWWGYGAGRRRLDDVLKRAPALYDLVQDRYRIDEIYVNFLVAPLVACARWTYERFDKNTIDGAVNGVGVAADALGGVLRRVQTGRVRDYTAWMLAGAVGMAAIVAVVVLR